MTRPTITADMLEADPPTAAPAKKTTMDAMYMERRSKQYVTFRERERTAKTDNV
jgi:hypothetical protein